MAQTIKLKRSSVSGNTPSTSDLELGEVAINTYDGKMFIKKNDGSDSIVEIGGNSGTVTEAFKTIAVSGQSSVVADSATDTLTLVAGSNMTLTTNASGDTITFASSGGGGTQNVFTTFAVSGQSSVVADSTTDTLTLVAGSGITLSTDNSADSITIAATASAITVQDEGSALSTSATTLNFVGAGVTATGTGATKTITIPGTGTVSEAFKTIAVSGQSNVVADGATDTLTLAAGSGMTITTNASNDTITFASSGGSGSQNVFSNIAVSGQGTVQADATTDTLTVVAGTGISLTTDTSADSLTITNTGSVNVANAASSIKEFKYDISSSTTTITGSDANSNTLAYEAEAIQVFLNGILLDPATDYTATNGTSVVLTDAAVSGDDVQIISFNRKIVTANVGIDTFTGNGSTTAYTLSSDPVNENNTRVHIDGVYQEKAAYSVSGTTLTFSAAPPNGSSIEVEVGFTQAEIGSTLDFADNAILRIGTGNDLQILHDGSNSIIKDTGTGDLQIAASTLEVKNSGINETMIKAIENGAVELYHNNNKKLETVTGGVTITGTVTATTFSGDLSGTINSATTGTTQSASDNSTKIATTAYVDTAVTNLVDSAPGTLNTLNELAAALGDDANFSTTITNSLNLKVGRDSATGAASIPAGTTAQRPGSPAAGQFRYNSTLNQFEGYTSSWGAIGGGGTNTFTTDVFTANGSTAAFTLTQAVSSPNDCIVHVDGIYQTPTDAYGVSGTTLTFTATPANGRKIVVYSVKAGVSGNNLNIQTFSGNGSATSFTMNVNPINENNTIIHIDGVYQQKTSYSTSGTTLTFSAAPANGTTIEVATFTQTEINVPVNDTIDTVHIKDDAVTSAKLGGDLVIPGHMSFSDNKEVRIGAGDDLKLYHDSNNSYISDTGTGDLIITGTVLRPRTDQFTLNNAANSENMINAVADGAVTLYYDGSAKLATASGGVTVTGTLTATTLAGTLSTAAQTNITSVGTLTALTVDDITIDGSTISDAGDLTLDIGGNIILNADGAYWKFEDGSTELFQINSGSQNTNLRAMVQDKDIRLQGYDGSSLITALTLDMSEAGAATFNAGVAIADDNNFSFGDGTTYIQGSGAADRIKFITAGSEAVRIDSSGYVGIGETSFSNYLAPDLVVVASAQNGGITVKSSSTSHAGTLAFADATSGTDTYDGYVQYEHNNRALTFATAATERLRINSGGHLGIGTSAPDLGSGWNKVLHLHSAGAGSHLRFTDNNTGATGDSGLFVGQYHNGSYFINRENGAMLFYTNNTERVRILAGGNVGIGTNNPGYKLEVNGTAHVVNTLTAGAIGIPSQGITLNQGFGSGVPTLTMTGTSSTNGRAGAILFNEYGDVNCAAIYSTDGAGGNANYGGLLLATYQSDIRFSTGGLSNTRMIIKANGNVGIGTGSTASKKLHITGNDNQLVIDANGSSSNSGLFFAEQGTDKWEVYHRGVDDTFRIYNYGTSSPNIQISAAGAVTKEKQPYVQGRGNAGWSPTAGSATWNLQPHNSTPIVSRDHGNNYSTTNKRFTCPVDGVYLVHASWYIHQTAAASAGGQYIHPGIFKNGSSNWNGGHQPYTIVGHQIINSSSTSAKHYDGVQISFTIYCSASDYLEIYLYSPNSNPKSYEHYHYFSYTLLS